MKKIIIISPDPQTRRMFSLRFELDGFTTREALDTEEAQREALEDGTSLILLDMINDSPSQWNEVRSLLSGSLSRSRRGTIIILPHGREWAIPKSLGGGPTLVVKKPYELETLVREVKRLASQRV